MFSKYSIFKKKLFCGKSVCFCPCCKFSGHGLRLTFKITLFPLKLLIGILRFLGSNWKDNKCVFLIIRWCVSLLTAPTSRRWWRIRRSVRLSGARNEEWQSVSVRNFVRNGMFELNVRNVFEMKCVRNEMFESKCSKWNVKNQIVESCWVIQKYLGLKFNQQKYKFPVNFFYNIQNINKVF
jgi:hypothetical protein